MFILATFNAFAILGSCFVWAAAGVGAALLVAAPVHLIFVALSNDQEVAGRVTLFVVAGVVLIAILSGAFYEFQDQLEQEERDRSFLQQPIFMYEDQLSSITPRIN